MLHLWWLNIYFSEVMVKKYWSAMVTAVMLTILYQTHENVQFSNGKSVEKFQGVWATPKYYRKKFENLFSILKLQGSKSKTKKSFTFLDQPNNNTLYILELLYKELNNNLYNFRTYNRIRKIVNIWFIWRGSKSRYLWHL